MKIPKIGYTFAILTLISTIAWYITGNVAFEPTTALLAAFTTLFLSTQFVKVHKLLGQGLIVLGIGTLVYGAYRVLPLTLNREKNISFASTDNPGELNEILIWYEGDSANDFNLTKEPGTLIVSAASGTDQWENINSAPTIGYPIVGDFEAQVKVKFIPTENVQAAGFGVRAPGNPDTFFRILMHLFKDSQEIVVHGNDDGMGFDVGHTTFSIQEVFFKIGKLGSNYTFSYSTDDKNWMSIAQDSSFELTNVEIYFVVLSNYNPSGVFAEFSEFKIIKH